LTALRLLTGSDSVVEPVLFTSAVVVRAVVAAGLVVGVVVVVVVVGVVVGDVHSSNVAVVLACTDLLG